MTSAAAEARANTSKGSLQDVVFKLAAKLAGKNLWAAFESMQTAQWLAPEQLFVRSDTRLAALLRHAAVHVPFYRGVCEREGLRLDDIRSIDQLNLFPVLGKAEYRQCPPSEFVADSVPEYRHIHRTTSGSTGEPFAFSLDRNALPVIFASHLFYDSWIGLRPFDRYVRIVSPPGAVPPAEGPTGFRLRQEITRRLQQFYEARTQRKLPVWEVDSRRAVEIRNEIESFRPSFVLGYTSALADIADELRRRELPLTRNPRGVITVAETLTPARRSAIERYFQAPITNRYGLRELGSWSAQSCEKRPDSFHVNTELVICEILRDDGLPAEPGETGRVVLTDLWNFARPFIRYFTGDVATAGQPGRCECGRGFPLMGPIDGRSQECLRTVSGKIISPVVLGHYLVVYHDHHDAIREYQLVQEARDRVRLVVVPASAWSDSVGEMIRHELVKLLGGDMQVRIETTADIPPDASGKRPIIKILRG